MPDRELLKFHILQRTCRDTCFLTVVCTEWIVSLPCSQTSEERLTDAPQFPKRHHLYSQKLNHKKTSNILDYIKKIRDSAWDHYCWTALEWNWFKSAESLSQRHNTQLHLRNNPFFVFLFSYQNTTEYLAWEHKPRAGRSFHSFSVTR